jgi:hypothetical protein
VLPPIRRPSKNWQLLEPQGQKALHADLKAEIMESERNLHEELSERNLREI